MLVQVMALVPSGSKLLPGPMLSQMYVTILASLGHDEVKYIQWPPLMHIIPLIKKIVQLSDVEASLRSCGWK